jgi:hypothetical protein
MEVNTVVAFPCANSVIKLLLSDPLFHGGRGLTLRRLSSAVAL